MRMIRDPGDILDRFSIATLKKERIGLPSNIHEYHLFEQGYADLCNEFNDQRIYLANMLSRLIDINSHIWNLESAVRQGQLDSDIPEVGRRAISIRQTNAKRIMLCNEINRHFNEGVENVKKYHVSGEGSPDKA